MRAAEPLVETDAAEPGLTQWHERTLLHPAAEVSGLLVLHHLSRIADRLEIAGDKFAEPCSFRARGLDNAASRRRERRLGNRGSNVVCRDGLEQTGRQPDDIVLRYSKRRCRREIP